MHSVVKQDGSVVQPMITAPKRVVSGANKPSLEHRIQRINPLTAATLTG